MMGQWSGIELTLAPQIMSIRAQLPTIVPHETATVYLSSGVRTSPLVCDDIVLLKN